MNHDRSEIEQAAQYGLIDIHALDFIHIHFDGVAADQATLEDDAPIRHRISVVFLRIHSSAKAMSASNPTTTATMSAMNRVVASDPKKYCPATSMRTAPQSNTAPGK
jgi:hypothetical protein